MIPMPAPRTPRHPGRILRDDFLDRLGEWVAAEVADRLGMTRPRLSEFLNGNRGVTPDTAYRLARGFGTSARFWMDAQADWDLYEAARDRRRMREVERIRPLLSDDEGSPTDQEPTPLPSASIPLEIAAQAQAAAGAAESGAVGYYEEFLARRGLLREAKRFARVRAQLDALEQDPSDRLRRRPLAIRPLRIAHGLLDPED